MVEHDERWYNGRKVLACGGASADLNLKAARPQPDPIPGGINRVAPEATP